MRRMDSHPVTKPFEVRGHLVTPQRNAIHGPHGETSIEPKIMAVLCVLAGEPGRVFTRAELIDQVWGTEFGADESLTRSISLLRKALGDTRSEPAVIETIPKRGYRLLPSALSALDKGPPPKETPHPPPASFGRRAWIAAAVLAAAGMASWRLRIWPFPSEVSGDPAPGTITIVVLPFNPVRKEPSQTSLAAALTVDLVGALAKEKRLHVTVKRPDGAKQPGAGRRYSIYADLQTDEGQVKANVEIMDFDSGQALWSRLYEQPFDGKLSSQDRLAALIARDLTAALLAMAGRDK
jgi:DNA-binding winged helix-turn-helix (wHTH) protein/TolB-like protein